MDTLPPRPQFARPEWIDLRGDWGFAFDDRDRGLQECWQERSDVFDRTIVVPFPPESPASGIDDPSYHPVVWYRRTFTVPPEDEGKRLLLNFGAVDYRAIVWVNGQLQTIHEGGHTSFTVDITEALRPQGEQVIVVRAQDFPHDLAQPRGKQDWREKPHGIWYRRTTGIWQPVWLEPVEASYITELRWTPDLDRGVLGVLIGVHIGTGDPLRVRVRLKLQDNELVDDTFLVSGMELKRDIALELGSLTMERSDVLWAPSHPNLLDAEVTLVSNDVVVDTVVSYVGLRSVGVSGGRFMLNGRPYYLRLALEQGYWPESHLAAPSDEALRREVQLARQLGFNGVRIHQKVEDPRFLYWCDKLGLLVWGEMANAYVFSRHSVERLTREWLDVLSRDYSHPCIVAWVPINESWGVPNLLNDRSQQHFVQTMYHLTKSLDPTRPVIGNDGWEYVAGDILGIHDYSPSGEALRERYGSTERVERTLREVQPGDRAVTLASELPEKIPVMLTEFGGISYRPAANTPWFGYGTVENTEDFEAKYRELLDAVLSSSALAGFCYTQLTDTGQETNGLLTADRVPKLPPAVIRAITRQPSAALPADVIHHMQQQASTGFAGATAVTVPEF